MKRRVYRSRKLPPFQCDLPELENLISEVSSAFEPAEKLSFNASFKLPGEDVSFESAAELTAWRSSVSRATDVTLRWYDWQTGRECRIGKAIWSGQASVIAEAPTELWCATVTELVSSFATRHKRWYWPLAPWIWSVAFFCMGFGPTLLRIFGVKVVTDGLALAYLCAYIPVGLFFFRHEKILPAIVVRLKSEPNWVREFNPELTLALTVISVVVGIIALFLG
jgi:hypothetical protein